MTMKKILCLLLTAALLLGCLSACGGTEEAASPSKAQTDEQEAPVAEEKPQPEAQEAPAAEEKPQPETQEAPPAAEEAPSEALEIAAPGEALQPVVGNEVYEKSGITKSGSFDNAAERPKRDGIAYVLIYNPNPYSEKSSFNEILSTGKLGGQIDISLRRADRLEEERNRTPVSQKELLGDFDLSEIQLDPEMNRADKLVTPYKVGDRHMFYCGYTAIEEKQFECVYTGAHCNIWTNENNSGKDKKAIEKLGKEFDNKIYDADVRIFGTPRFAENGGKVNLLVYDYQSTTVLGFFKPGELFATGEIPAEVIEEYKLNQDHAIVHLNRLLLQYSEVPEVERAFYSTAAHEFQHLICMTDYFENGGNGFCDTWLNEAMSGYIEETLYEGAQDGCFKEMASSDRIRKGQSLYDFSIDNTLTEFDIGVYGSTFLFSELLAGLGGEEVFHKIHDHWRTSLLDTTDAAAIMAAMPKDVVEAVDGQITYPSGFVAGSKEEQWLSKLVLLYYIQTLKAGGSGALAELDPMTLLYDEINPAEIAGGGRIIVATKDGSYSYPKDADKGLIYIGLDSDFNVITKPHFH